MEKDGDDSFFSLHECIRARKWLRGESIDIPLLSDDFVAKLQIRPPSNDHPAICMLQDVKEGLVDDPISLCIVGGIRYKAREICSQNKAIGGWKCNKSMYCSFFVLLILVIMIEVLSELLIQSQSDVDEVEDGNEDNRSAWIFRYAVNLVIWVSWSAWANRRYEKEHRSSEAFLSSKRVFWDSWNESGIEMKLEETLAECGYSVQVVPNEYYWYMTVRKVGSQQSLPPVTKTDLNLNRPARDKEVVFSSGCISQHEAGGPRDMWTQQGLLLGIGLSSQIYMRRTTAFSCILMCCWVPASLYAFFSANILYIFSVFAVCGILIIGAVRIFYKCVDQSQVISAHHQIINRFSELIQARCGCRVEYEIRPACYFATRRVIKYVKEEQV